ncbi:hypothetical protein D0469_19080 [Peribacillus saganii]|uniref:Methylmalonyl-CoA mutase alpha/beta chain catalytic domain-containing protein n=1 Tax=Peribacillus saganii TaxID=2303992 RepID=A0A372LDK2_9BACI|nr:methylmalonyl-CoA mutase family protein [Peribacillus saganii]RFU64222.1 hypothetical protein D0469_19080 [Peribacillus saganii]
MPCERSVGCLWKQHRKTQTALKKAITMLENVKNQSFQVPSYEEWKAQTEASLKGKSFESLITHTYEGIELQPIYTPGSLKGSDESEEFPGEFPYTRGINHTGYKEMPWLMCQPVSGKTAEQVNENLKKALSRGQNAVVFDSDALLGLDTASLRTVLEGINAEEIPFFLDLQGNQKAFLAMLRNHCKAVGLNSASLAGVIGEDPISEWSKEGKLPADIDGFFTMWFEGLKRAEELLPKVKTILVKGSVFHNSGATAVQELAYALSAAVHYIQEGSKNGLDPGTIAEKMVFSFGIDSNFFMNIAKLRAARRLWAHLAHAYGASRDSFKMHIHAETSSFTETVYDKHVNILRSTNQAFAAAIGGVQYLTVRPFDAASELNGELAARLAGNTQLILREETHITAVADPAGGSWYIEALTDELTEKSWEKFLEIEEKNGILKLLKEGSIQEDIRQVFSKKQMDAAIRKSSIVGTNVYADPAEESGVSLEKELPIIRNTAAPDDLRLNWDRLVEVFSTSSLQNYRSLVEQAFPSESIQHVNAERLSSQFEMMRIRSEKYKHSNGQTLKVGIINLRDIKSYKPRADFISGFLASGGIIVTQSDGCQSIADAVKFIESSGLAHFCLCGSDGDYEVIAQEFVSKLKHRFGNVDLYLAGKLPEEQAKKLREAGLSDFVHARTNPITFLDKLHQAEGVNSL